MSKLLPFTAYEMSLANGLHFERRLFHQLFATVRRRVSPLRAHLILFSGEN